MHGHAAHVVVYHAVAIHAVIICHPHVVREIAFRGITRFLRAALALLFPRKKISVVTPTWKRQALLAGRCIPAVRAQSYRGPVEHVIVSDGPDPDLDMPGVCFLPEHKLAPNRGIWARLHGTEISTGEYVGYLDDDNAWKPYHLELLADALEDSGADFAYSRARCIDPGGYKWTIGCDPPQFAQIDTSLILHRRGLLDVAQWKPSSFPADWDLVLRWVQAGASWVHVPVVTLDYYVQAPATAICSGT